ncbi:hypothetical protein RJ641_022294 [Dillenia turbinata]|uniref:Uncharacterized protein n=1 Tax=Dillenia turbinata TaxID=194707 RepID=A0AAN8YWZ0_9MAGN
MPEGSPSAKELRMVTWYLRQTIFVHTGLPTLMMDLPFSRIGLKETCLWEIDEHKDKQAALLIQADSIECDVSANVTSKLSGADCANTRDPVLMQSDLLIQNRQVNSINAKDVSVGNDLLHASLRKCSKTPNSAVKCHTPGSLTMQPFSHDTPRSTGGSSTFSPGESFWNEAIQVVDGLFSQTDNCVSRPVDELDMANFQFEEGASFDKRDGNCNGKSKVMTQEDKSSIQLMEVTASAGTVERSARVSGKEVSPLPVKHFDFSFEDKNLDRISSSGCPSSDKNGVTTAAGQSSVKKKTLVFMLKLINMMIHMKFKTKPLSMWSAWGRCLY